MSKLVILFVCLAVLQASLALKCQKCSNADCSKTEEETCTPGSTQKAGCLKEIYTDSANKEVLVKKCVLYPKDLPKYACVNAPDTKGKSCDVCETDNCNSKAPSIGLSIFALVGVAVAIVVPKFM